MLVATFLVMMTATAAAAQVAETATPLTIEVSHAVVATGVQDREPVGAGESFPADVGSVFFYNILEGEFAELEIQHVWLREGEELARIPLRARGPRWRTWSSKQIPSEWSGKWTVQVVAGGEQVLKSVDFTVGM